MPTVPVDEIKIGDNRRPLKEETVGELMKSIQTNGLLNPITVDKQRNLIAGLHRLTAYKRLGMKEIDCNIVDYKDSDQARLAEIDENLIRNELEALERADLWLEREQLLERMGLRAKPGDNQHTLKAGEMISPPRTNRELAQEIGFSERTLQHGLQIAKNTHPEVKKKIKGTAIAKSPTNLVKVARAGSKERLAAQEAQKALLEAEAKGDTEEAIKQAKLLEQALTEQKQQQMLVVESAEAEKEAKAIKKVQPKPPTLVTTPDPAIKSGAQWMLGTHLLYCGDTNGKEFIKLLPSNAALAIATVSAHWDHDYLIDEARVVVVLRTSGHIHEFCRRHRMPFQYELLLGNIYVGIFAKKLISKPQTSVNITGVEGIIAYLINLYTNPNNYVIAPFIGDGEVLISCERMGRTCFIGDDNPESVRRGITRWQNLTQKQIEKII
jgi:ParB family chromosome partitioning protein